MTLFVLIIASVAIVVLVVRSICRFVVGEPAMRIVWNDLIPMFGLLSCVFMLTR